MFSANILGFSISKSFGIDKLHTVALGVEGDIVTATYWRAVDAAAIAGAGDIDARERQAFP